MERNMPKVWVITREFDHYTNIRFRFKGWIDNDIRLTRSLADASEHLKGESAGDYDYVVIYFTPPSYERARKAGRKIVDTWRKLVHDDLNRLDRIVTELTINESPTIKVFLDVPNHNVADRFRSNRKCQVSTQVTGTFWNMVAEFEKWLPKATETPLALISPAVIATTAVAS